MRTLALTTVLFLIAGGTTLAQDTKSTAPVSKEKHHCIMADASTLGDLALSEEQIVKVKDVQSACLKEHDAAKAAGTAFGTTKYEEQLKAILTPDQFAKWSQWCDANKAMNGKK